jgi:hypothetical protein
VIAVVMPTIMPLERDVVPDAVAPEDERSLKIGPEGKTLVPEGRMPERPMLKRGLFPLVEVEGIALLEAVPRV